LCGGPVELPSIEAISNSSKEAVAFILLLTEGDEGSEAVGINFLLCGLQ